MMCEGKITVVKQGARDIIREDKRVQTLTELKKIKDELLTLARRVDKTIEEVEAA